MKRSLLNLALCLLAFPACALLPAAPATLGEDARISLLTCSPSDEEVFTVYGHTAIRVSDPDANLDIVFNYGIFDFSKPGFVYRFTKGETDYKLAAGYYDNFIAEYRLRGSSVTEQTLNLTPDEINALWQALLVNLRPENAVYRYNFFFDNCATRPAQLIERCVAGEIVYRNEPERKSFRQLINYYMRNQPWLVFGCQLALGSPTDRIATLREEFFLPLLLEKAFDRATIVNPGGEERPLVSATNVLPASQPPPPTPRTLLPPLLAALAALAVTGLLTRREWKKHTYYPALDVVLFTLAGLGGTILFFLAFVSEHPAVWPNWQLIALHPLHLAGAALSAAKKTRKMAYYYHLINFAALTAMLMGWPVLPQRFHIALLPVVVSLWARSGRYVFSKPKHKQI
jgi:hypothetical protein